MKRILGAALLVAALLAVFGCATSDRSEYDQRYYYTHDDRYPVNKFWQGGPNASNPGNQ